MNEWVVVMELQKPHGTGLLQLSQLEALVQRLKEFQPSAIFNPDRYALQIRILAAQPSEALSSALSFHNQATGALSMPGWPVVRVEVLTPDELEKDFAHHEMRDDVELGGFSPRLDENGSDALYQATRELLRVRSAEEAKQVLVRFVHKMGGFVVSQPEENVPTLPIDLSFGQGDPALPAVESFEAVGLRLQGLLPALVKDAEEAVDRLRRAVGAPLQSTRKDPAQG